MLFTFRTTDVGSRWISALLLMLACVGPTQANDTITYYYTSPQGTVLAKADASGNLIENADYRPYGAQVLGISSDGPGYTGHVNDADTELVYMQARYYDPETQTFLSVDPKRPKAGDIMSFSRYAYANLNPMTRIDPDGRDGQLFWTATNAVTYTVPYIIGVSPGAQMSMTTAEINAAVAQRFSGTVTLNGTDVTVTARAVDVSGTNSTGTTNFIKVVNDSRSVTASGRPETNAVGGNRVTLSASGPYKTDANIVGHEVGGHLGGAGDQYATGVDVNGNVLQQDAPGASGVMYDMNGGANEQTMREILSAPTNSNSCASGVKAANGGC